MQGYIHIAPGGRWIQLKSHVLIMFYDGQTRLQSKNSEPKMYFVIIHTPHSVHIICKQHCVSSVCILWTLTMEKHCGTWILYVPDILHYAFRHVYKICVVVWEPLRCCCGWITGGGGGVKMDITNHKYFTHPPWKKWTVLSIQSVCLKINPCQLSVIFVAIWGMSVLNQSYWTQRQ